MSRSSTEQPSLKPRSLDLIQFLFLVGLIAVLHAPMIAVLHRIKGQVEVTNQRIQELEKKLDELKSRKEL